MKIVLEKFILAIKNIEPVVYGEIIEIIYDYEKIVHDEFDIDLFFELAKEKYMSGEIRESKQMFRKLRRTARHHPKYLRPDPVLDRWYDEGKPMALTGLITRKPTTSRHGNVNTTSPYSYRDSMIVRYQNLENRDIGRGTRVKYEVLFNMLGPQATRVTRG